MEAIREFERETQILLQKKFGLDGDDEDGDGTYTNSLNLFSFSIFFISFILFYTASTIDLSTSKHSSQFQSIEKTEETPMFPKKLQEPPQLKEQPPSIDSSEGEDDIEITTISKTRKERLSSGQLSQHSKYGSKHGLHSPIGSTHSFDLQVKMNFLCIFFFQFSVERINN